MKKLEEYIKSLTTAELEEWYNLFTSDRDDESLGDYKRMKSAFLAFKIETELENRG